MNIRKSSVAIFSAVVFALPAVSYANSQWHATDTEAGVTYKPDHFKSNATRAGQAAEVQAARNSGTLAIGERGAAPAVKTAGGEKTRSQVIDEMRSQTPAERQAQQQLLAGS